MADDLSAARPRLAIAIPAYGRAATTAAAVAAMADEAQGLPISFHISDDTPDTSLADALAPLIAAGRPVSYRRNTPALGHDRNLVATLLWPDADYVWLLGSSYRSGPGELARVLGFLAGQDLVFLNANAPGQPEMAAMRGETAVAFLRDLLWHHTLTGATIYGARVRDWVRGRGEALVVVPNFPQICTMMGFATANALTVGWLGGRPLAKLDIATTSYWRDRALEVFGRDWSRAVRAFPAVVPPRDVARVTRAHSIEVDLFNTHYLTTLKAEGKLRWSSLREPGVREAIHLPWWKLLAVMALPVSVLRAGGTTLERLKHRLGRG